MNEKEILKYTQKNKKLIINLDKCKNSKLELNFNNCIFQNKSSILKYNKSIKKNQ